MDTSDNAIIFCYPNRKDIIEYKDDYAWKLITECQKGIANNRKSINFKVKKLRLFINGEKISKKEIKFPKDFFKYEIMPRQIKVYLYNRESKKNSLDFKNFCWIFIR